MLRPAVEGKSLSVAIQFNSLAKRSLIASDSASELSATPFPSGRFLCWCIHTDGN